MEISRSHLKERLLKYFIVSLLFIAPISYRLSPILAYLILVANLGLVISTGVVSRMKISKKNLIFYSFFFLLLVLIPLRVLYKLYLYGVGDFYPEQFFFSWLLFLFVIPYFVDLKNFLIKNYLKILYTVFYIISFYTLYELIVFYVLGLPNLQFMYNPELKSYLGKPFTLLGQPSVTSIVSTFLYITIRELKVKKNKWLFIIYLLSILSFQTGTGYISLLIVCFYLTWKYKVYYLLGLPLVGIIMYYIVINNVVVKLSHTYFVFLIELFEKFIIDYLEAVSRNYDLLMGCDPSYDLPIDLGPLFYIGKLGLITFVIYSLLLLVIMFTQRNLSLRFIILILLFGNLHYPVMFYPIMNIFLMFTLYIVITFGFNNFVLCQRKENSQ